MSDTPKKIFANDSKPLESLLRANNIKQAATQSRTNGVPPLVSALHSENKGTPPLDSAIKPNNGGNNNGQGQ